MDTMENAEETDTHQSVKECHDVISSDHDESYLTDIMKRVMIFLMSLTFSGYYSTIL